MWGMSYNCRSDSDFNSKIKNMAYVSKEIQTLDNEIKTGIAKAMQGEDPQLHIKIDDCKLNLEVYQQIVSKVYAVIRYKVYQKIKNKHRKSNKRSKQLGQSDENDSNDMPETGLKINEITATVIVGEKDIEDLLNEIDAEAIRQEVFNIYNIKYGLNTSLALRKVQILESGDKLFQNYLECLEEAHNRFLSFIE